MSLLRTKSSPTMGLLDLGLAYETLMPGAACKVCLASSVLGKNPGHFGKPVFSKEGDLGFYIKGFN